MQTDSIRVSNRYRSEVPWVVMTGMICAHFSLIYNNGGNGPFLSLSRYAAGQEALPFQARVLMAWVFRLGVKLPFIVKAATHLPRYLHDPYTLIQTLVSFIALFAAICCTRGSLRLLTGDRDFSRWAALIVAGMAYFNMPLIYGPSYTLPYDMPSLFFFCAGSYCILRRRLTWFYLLFIPATLNRETTCFLTLFFLISEWTQMSGADRKLKMIPVTFHVLAQACIWLGIKLYLQHQFAHNPMQPGTSTLFQAHFAYNLREILKPQQWPLLLSNFGFTLPFLFLQRQWIKDRRISLACGILLPLWLAVMLYVGAIVEIRIFTELISIVSLGVTLIFYHRWYAPAGDAAKE